MKFLLILDQLTYVRLEEDVEIPGGLLEVGLKTQQDIQIHSENTAELHGWLSDIAAAVQQDEAYITLVGA